MIVANRPGGPWFFIKGFAKNAMENVDRETLLYCRADARELIASSAESLEVMVKRNNLKEAICDAQAQERAH